MHTGALAHGAVVLRSCSSPYGCSALLQVTSCALQRLPTGRTLPDANQGLHSALLEVAVPLEGSDLGRHNQTLGL